MTTLSRNPIPTLKVGDGGHQFVVYGDSCSGIAGAPHEATFRQINAAIRALDQQPEFIGFLGDEIMGLTTDADELRRQWQHFFGRELAWLDRDAIPLYHTTGNHTTYDAMSEGVFREFMRHLPLDESGGLSYFVRRGDLLLVFADTLDSAAGGEGTVDVVVARRRHAPAGDARYKLVFGHHPVWPVNGYAGDYQQRDRAGERPALLGRATAPRRARLLLQPYPGIRCASALGHIADMHRRRRYCPSHAARARVPALAASRAG